MDVVSEAVSVLVADGPELTLDGKSLLEPNYPMCAVWCVAIGFMFFAQHHVCDAYFVPAINVFVEAMKTSKTKCLNRWGEEAVAGATICALGCNGPELFSNLIALYTCSDAGIGVVVGSEIFNLLIIVGCATLAAPSLIVFERGPFTRDIGFYAISIVLVYFFFADGKISFVESGVLLAAAVVYVMAVYFTTDIVNAIVGKDENSLEAPFIEEGAQKATIHGVEVEVTEDFHGRMQSRTHCSTHEIEATPHGICAGDAGTKPGQRQSVGVQLENSEGNASGLHEYVNLKEVVYTGEHNIRLEFKRGLEHATLVVNAKTSANRKKLADAIHEYDAIVWVHTYDATIIGAFDHLKHAFTDPKSTLVMKLGAIPEFLIDFLLKGTLFAVDVKDGNKEGRWMLCFCGAMFWLAAFSYAMLMMADFIHYNVSTVPTSFLGITVCAIGTSFPNAVASVIMASQNKPAAAIANALGSNVQNVFLAMAMPWVIFQCFPGQDCSKPPGVMAEQYANIPASAAGLQEGILWMLGTLVLLVIFVLLPETCTISKFYGIILIGVYVVYLVETSYKAFSM